ncbi:MAG: transcription termination/antitermination protein NusA [Armatimonadota bacterium]|nr:MAG: transcription termination/antitermination protein NusA [Armatimonadota bacterium]
MQMDFVQALRDIEKEKDIPLETLEEILEAALVSAYRKHYGSAGEIHVEIDWDDSRASIYARKLVVETVEDTNVELSIEDARKLDAGIEVGESVDIEVTPENFGRIAAQTAKQVVVQRIREAEREIIFSEFSDRAGEVVTGIVQRRTGRSVFINVGKVEALLPASEQMSSDACRFGERLKVYVVEVKRTTKTPHVLVSRSHPGLLRRLFELEVPEVHDGVVEIKAIAREAGLRSKVAVFSRQDNVDPVGACVGHRGSRVQAVVDELRGEKIDIVRWSDEMSRYLASALSPARVNEVVVDEDQKTATVIVPDNQLSLAIGKEGQNVRLAARLTGWRIDIRSETQIAEMEEAMYAELDARATATISGAADADEDGPVGAEEVGEPSAEFVVGGERDESAVEAPAEGEVGEEAEAEPEAQAEAAAEPETSVADETPEQTGEPEESPAPAATEEASGESEPEAATEEGGQEAAAAVAVADESAK